MRERRWESESEWKRRARESEGGRTERRDVGVSEREREKGSEGEEGLVKRQSEREPR